MMDTENISIAQAKVRIARTHYQAIASSSNHAIVVDEPADMGGGDTGMNPFGLLLGSLGSCTIITLRMYIERKMWVVDEINVELEAFAVEGGHLIQSKLDFKGDLTTEQISRLLTIANSCPIHKVLAGNITMETAVA